MRKRATAKLSGLRTFALACAWLAAAGTAHAQGAAPGPAVSGRVVGIAYVGRMVADLDKSVAFYQALGFTRDRTTDPAWRSDASLDRLFGIRGASTASRR